MGEVSRRRIRARIVAGHLSIQTCLRFEGTDAEIDIGERGIDQPPFASPLFDIDQLGVVRLDEVLLTQLLEVSIENSCGTMKSLGCIKSSEHAPRFFGTIERTFD